MDGKEIGREGIAVNLDIAIKHFKGQIDKKATISSRLFDQELMNDNLKFLDIGCGIGGHLLILRNNGIQYAFGFDIVYRLVQIAKKEYGLQDLMVANGMRIPLIDGSVDRVILYNVIEHCSEPIEVLKEIYRVLSRDGILYMDAPNARSTSDRIFRWGGRIVYGKTSHIQKFTMKKIDSLVEKAGFCIDECKTNRGIFVDYPQIKRFTYLKRLLKFLFDKEIRSWELKLVKKS